MALRMSKRLQKEYESIQKNNQEMKASLPNNDLTLWHVNFQGAKGTLYEGENFTLQLRFNNEYVATSLLSRYNPHRSSSLVTYHYMSISTPMVLFAYRFYMMVDLILYRMVSSSYSYFCLLVCSLDA
jgi:hypothetical protein